MATTTVASVPARNRGPLQPVLLTMLGFAIAGGVLYWFVGRSATSWGEVRGTLAQVGVLDLAVLTFVWAAGLWCHSWVLTAALPGLSRRRALLLNVSGSAVSDLMPFGAAAGTGVGFAMARSWNFSAKRYASFTTISNLWNVVAKLALPALVLAYALAGGTIQAPRLVGVVEVALVTAGLLGVAAVASIADARVAALLGRSADRLILLISGLIGKPRTTHLARAFPAIRGETAAVIRRGWLQLTAGVVGYLLLQAVLWYLCLRAVGEVPALPIVCTG